MIGRAEAERGVLPVNFLSDTGPLAFADAVAAIIVAEDGRYLLQRRDDIPGIFYPGHWSCFGGALLAGEDPADCLRRELFEELEFKANAFRDFANFHFDLAPVNGQRVFRRFFEVPASRDEIARFVLHEGAEMRLFHATEMFDRVNLAPYDSFALWMHSARSRFGGGKIPQSGP